ncbi:DUF4390 domain-containing protein [Desulfogranum marinum]|uniref:DUF4390 domain-containing protein n=1 Tax=Desulfogranum marinum TaxID=453220 RepID=UPI001962C2FD|nr:DUF4390 domain-containing protein [Desulfogranum marinum]MBM9512535.1 DUF4390 domain-containing protein [Desulfogranum marinum]
MTRFVFQLTLLFFCLTVIGAGQISAQDDISPELKDIIVTTSNTDLLLFATVLNAFTPEMITGVQNGIPITFTFYVELNKLRSNWLDSSLIDTTITHTMTYNSLKEEYEIYHSDKNGKVKRTRSLKEAKELMAELNGLRVIPLEQLQPEAQYALRLKATLEKNSLPLGIHYVLPFTSLWDFETDWRTIEFRY